MITPEQEQKAMMVAVASLIAQGYCYETDEGVHITNTGCDEAFKRWKKLPDEDRLLFPLLLKVIAKRQRA